MVGQTGHFMLTSKFATRFHPMVECTLRHLIDMQPNQGKVMVSFCFVIGIELLQL